MKIGLLLFLTLPLLLFAEATHPIRHAYLTWKDYTDRSITLNVHSIESPTIFVTFLENNEPVYQYESLGKPFLTSLSPRYLHHITAHNLKESQEYDILIESQDQTFSKTLKFRTLPKKSEGLRLAFGGDWEVCDKSKDIARLIAAKNVDALILGGDYPRFVNSIDDYEKWDQWLDHLTQSTLRKDGCSIPMILAIGNHDVFGHYNQPRANAPFYNNYFMQTKHRRNYFTKTLGDDIVLFVLDSGHTAPHGAEQQQWLAEMLKRHQHKKIKIAIYHVPLFPSVRFFNENLAFKAADLLFHLQGDGWKSSKLLSYETQQGRKYWLPLFDHYHLTAAFEHHEHSLKRTKPMRQGRVDSEGTVYFGDGAIAPKDHHTPIQTFMQDYFAKTIGYINFFWLVDIDKDCIRYRAIASHGRTVDEYVQPLN